MSVHSPNCVYSHIYILYSLFLTYKTRNKFPNFLKFDDTAQKCRLIGHIVLLSSKYRLKNIDHHAWFLCVN